MFCAAKIMVASISWMRSSVITQTEPDHGLGSPETRKDSNRWTENGGADLADGIASAETAIRLDPNEALAIRRPWEALAPQAPTKNYMGYRPIPEVSRPSGEGRTHTSCAPDAGNGDGE